MATGLDLSFASASASPPDARVTLESPPETANANSPTLADLEAMIARAKSGLSARSYQRDVCRAARMRDGVVVVDMAALVWPSRPGLAYRLDLPEEARAGAVTAYRVRRRARLWTDGRLVHELPWRLEDAAFSWHPRLSPRDERGNVAPAPTVRLDHARLVLSAPVYGLLTVVGAACGFRHAFSLEVGKLDESGRPQRIDLDAVPVVAVWTGADGEEESVEADIAVPACAADLLESCEDGRAVFRTVIRSRRAPRYEVAYNACDGSVLGERIIEEDDEEAA